MAGATIERAAQLAARTSGDSTVAYGIAFARAVEAALNVEAPPRAHYLRALMAELERLANHLGDIGAICNDASFALMHAHCGVLREQVLRAADACVRPSADDGSGRARRRRQRSQSDGASRIREALQYIRQRFPRLVELYDNTASLQDRTVGPELFAPNWRGSSGAGLCRARQRPQFRCAENARLPALRSARLCRSGTDGRRRRCPRVGAHPRSRAEPGADRANPRSPAGGADCEPLGRRRQAKDRASPKDSAATCWSGCGSTAVHVERCHLRDPSWFQWPLLEAAIEGNIVADFPLCNKSFNCSYSGHDLCNAQNIV